MRLGAVCAAFALAAGAARAQRAVTAADSALVRRILQAEDARDSSSTAFAEGVRSDDPRIRTIAKRAEGRVRDAQFAARDSLPALPAPPVYADPAWRMRYRALTRPDCATVRTALADSAWPVRLRAADLATPDCAAGSAIIRTLRAWADAVPATGARRSGGAGWQPAAHAIAALAKVTPRYAAMALPRFASSRVPWVRVYAARAAGTLRDTAVLRTLARDADDNVKEAALNALATMGHVGDGEAITALAAHGHQAVRAAARALQGSPRGSQAMPALLAAARRLSDEKSETSRDARMAVLDRIGEFASAANAADVAALASDFDCVVAAAAAKIAARLGDAGATTRCTPLASTLPRDAVALALGGEVRLRVTLADSSGGGSFVVRLRGDAAPIMAARVLELVRARAYDNHVWYRVEHDFVLQGGGPGANEYDGFPRFIRDELGGVPNVRGTVGMSTRGHDTGDAQWFINLRDNRRLDRDYSVFAEVVSGIEVVDGILEGDVVKTVKEERGAR